jgi:hypothetical protein
MLLAGRRKFSQECVVSAAEVMAGAHGGTTGADAAAPGVSQLRAAADSGGGAGDGAAGAPAAAAMSSSARACWWEAPLLGLDAGGGSGGKDGGGFAARASGCVAAAGAAEAAYASRRAELQAEIQEARLAGRRARRNVAVAAVAAGALGRDGRRALGDALSGLAGVTVAGAAARTDAQCKAQRVRARLEWRGLEWRQQHKYNPFQLGHSLDMAAAVVGNQGGGGGSSIGRVAAAVGSEAAFSPGAGPLLWAPLSTGAGATGQVRTMKAARRVVEGLAREQAERGRP